MLPWLKNSMFSLGRCLGIARARPAGGSVGPGPAGVSKGVEQDYLGSTKRVYSLQCVVLWGLILCPVDRATGI